MVRNTSEQKGPYVITSEELAWVEPLHIQARIRSRPLSSEMLKKENLDVALVAAYESGLKEGMRKKRDDAAERLP